MSIVVFRIVLVLIIVTYFLKETVFLCLNSNMYIVFIKILYR